MNEREKAAIDSAALVIANVAHSRSTGVGRFAAIDLHTAGLLATQDHIDALKACNSIYDCATGGSYTAYQGAVRMAMEVGQRSLASKAAAQESSVERVKRLWAKHGDGRVRELVEALDALVREGE